MIRITPLPRPLAVTAGRDAPPLPDDLARAVDTVWDEECRRRPLFDGRIFSIAAIGPERVDGGFVPYRRFLAAMRRPDLAERLAVRPLGVTGLLCCAAGLVLARRAATVTQSPCCWEPAPAGGIDAEALQPDGCIDVAGQLLRELAEELGIEAADCGSPRQVMLAEDDGEGVTDLVLALPCRLDEPAIRARFARAGGEYDQMAVVAPAAWRDFAVRQRLTPLAEAVLKAAAGNDALTCRPLS